MILRFVFKLKKPIFLLFSAESTTVAEVGVLIHVGAQLIDY